MRASSYYSGTQSSGSVKIQKAPKLSVKGKNVIIVDDVADSGITLGAVVKYIKGLNLLSVKTCVFLDKPDGRRIPFSADYSALKAGGEFVIGYGMDYKERFRNLPFVAVLKESVYS